MTQQEGPAQEQRTQEVGQPAPQSAPVSPTPLFHALVQHRPGAVRLDGFHLLTYAPQQWGEGVRTENNGTLVTDIVAAVESAGGKPDHTQIAKQFGVTEAHIRQAIAYNTMNPEG